MPVLLAINRIKSFSLKKEYLDEANKYGGRKKIGKKLMCLGAVRVKWGNTGVLSSEGWGGLGWEVGGDEKSSRQLSSCMGGGWEVKEF